MDVSTVGQVSAASSNTSSTSESNTDATVDYNTFLQLLLAQMRNQDPTKPMDSTEYMAQLANFSNVEQTMKANTKLDDLMTASSFNQAESLIGRTVTSADGNTSGQVEALRITDQGSVAMLAGGGEVAMTNGVTVS